MYIEIRDGTIVKGPLVLPSIYQLSDGRTLCGTTGYTQYELEAYGLFEVVEERPDIDERYEVLQRQPVVIEAGVPIQRYDVVKLQGNYPLLVEQRLLEFAREKDIDLSEIGALLTCGIPEWEQEAAVLQAVYTVTWQAYYTALETSGDWLEIEAQLPVLDWTTLLN